MRSPLEKGAAKGRDRLPRRGRIRQNGQRVIGDARKKGQRMCSADRYDELYPCGALQSSPFGAALLQGPAPMEGWRYSHIVSGIQIHSHVYSEFAFSTIVISSEAEKSLSVFIYLTYFPRETLNPSQQKSDLK